MASTCIALHAILLTMAKLYQSIACENSCPSVLPAQVAILWERRLQFTTNRKLYTDGLSKNFVILHKSANYRLLFYSQEKPDISGHHYTCRPWEVCAKPQNVFLTFVRVALVTSDIQRIFKVPATVEIHMEDQNFMYGLAWIKLNNDTVNRLVRKELHLNHVMPLSFKLDQIAAKNIRISLDKHIALSK